MNHQTDSFTTADNLKIFTQSWQPDDEPKAVVVIVHGLAEHSTRYQHVAEAFVEHGVATYALDHRGHGKSEGERVYFKSIDQPVGDLYQYFQTIQAQHPQKKLFMYGHSMGSIIALAFTLAYQQQLDGLLLSGTAITGDESLPNFVISLLNLVAKVFPKVRLIPALGSDTISSDPEQVKLYDSDPLVDRGAWRLGMTSVLVNAGRMVRGRLAELTLPLLIMHGEDDQLIPISGAMLAHEKASSTDKTLKTYPNSRHELVNEVQRDEIIQTMADWLVERS